jgi:hypothetical protein
LNEAEFMALNPAPLREVVAQAATSFFCAVTCCGLPGDDYGICRRWHAARIIWMAVAARVGMLGRVGEGDTKGEVPRCAGHDDLARIPCLYACDATPAH